MRGMPRPTNAPAAAQALDILALLSRHVSPMPASAIARDLGLPRSTAYHLLAILCDRGFVVHIAHEHRYGLGTAAFELGSAYTRQEPLRWVARTILTDLVARTTHSGHFAVLDGRDTLYLLEERGAGRASLVTDVGVRLPATLTATGLAMLAALPAEQVHALWPSRRDLARRTDQGPRSLTELRALLADGRRRGYAIEDGSVTAGFGSVAAPVLDHGARPLAAVGLTFPAGEVGADDAARLASQVRRAAAAVARHVRGTPLAPAAGPAPARPD